MAEPPGTSKLSSEADVLRLSGVRNLVKLPIEHIPTSTLIGEVLNNAPADHVTLAWLLASLRQRSFGMVMLLLGLMAMGPGVSVVAGFLLAALGFQMTMAQQAPVLPRFIAGRLLPTRQIARFIDHLIPPTKALEKFIRPRWHMPFMAAQRIVGFTVLMLAATLLVPIPLSNIIPGASTVLVALAYLEEDGVLLCVALIACLASLVITAVETWASVRGAELLLGL